MYLGSAAVAALRVVRALRVLRMFTVLQRLQEFLVILGDVIVYSLAYIVLNLYAGAHRQTMCPAAPGFWTCQPKLTFSARCS
jgi:hypothetical protein